MPFKCLKNIPAPVPVPAKRIQQCESHKVHAHHLSHIPLSVRTCHTHYCSELWCFTNLGSSVILYRMKKDLTVSGRRRLWQSACLMWMLCLYSESAFPPSTATFSACNDDLSLKFNSKLYPINVIASLDGFQEQWLISSGLSFFLAKSQETCYSDLLTHVDPKKEKKRCTVLWGYRPNFDWFATVASLCAWHLYQIKMEERDQEQTQTERERERIHHQMAHVKKKATSSMLSASKQASSNCTSCKPVASIEEFCSSIIK